MDPIPKPGELLALHDITAELFDTLKGWFDVSDEVAISLADIDSAIEELGDPVLVAAMAMRKLQALRLLAQPGVRTTTDVIVTIVQDLDRAMLQAPAMWLKRTAAETDWDAEFAALVEDQPDGAGTDLPSGPGAGPDGPDAASPDPGQGAAGEGELADPEVRRFRELHAGLHRALRAVVEVSDGQIRVLE